MKKKYFVKEENISFCKLNKKIQKGKINPKHIISIHKNSISDCLLVYYWKKVK